MPGRIDINPTPSSDAPERAGVYLLTHPRSASNMFQTMMEKQPGYQASGYKLFDAAFMVFMKASQGPLSEKSGEEREAMYDAFRQGAKNLEAELVDAKSKGLQAFVKEHAIFLRGPDKVFAAARKDDVVEPMVLEEPGTPHTNPSSLPDRLLLSLQPIFQIRHPMLMFPSMVRTQRIAMDPNLRPRDIMPSLCCTLGPSRQLYDWYLENAVPGREPRIIDADDIMNDKEAVRQLCIQTGMDPDAVQYEWETKQVKDEPKQQAFLSTISASKGILPGFASRGLDYEKEKEKWRKEFGDEDAEDMAKFVDDAMPDYEYMLSRRTRSGKRGVPA